MPAFVVAQADRDVRWRTTSAAKRRPDLIQRELIASGCRRQLPDDFCTVRHGQLRLCLYLIFLKHIKIAVEDNSLFEIG
jgi:hypothetical protein